MDEAQGPVYFPKRESRDEVDGIKKGAGPTFSKLLRKILGRFLILGQSRENI